MDPRKHQLGWSYYELANAADQRSYGEVFNSFSDLEPDYVEHYCTTLGRRVWLVGPVAHASKDMAARGSTNCLSLDTDSCLRWLDQKPVSSVLQGFVTHCAWNSVLEAVSAGVPLVAWPRYADQFYNEKLIVEVLKVGVGVGAGEYASKLEIRRQVICGEMIAEAIRAVMDDEEEAKAIRKKAKELRGKARSATEKGGSSYDDVGQLIDELMARRSSVNV